VSNPIGRKTFYPAHNAGHHQALGGSFAPGREFPRSGKMTPQGNTNVHWHRESQEFWHRESREFWLTIRPMGNAE
jgi:hypothetical protein